FFSSRRRHTRSKRDWSSDVCSSDLMFLTYGLVWMDRYSIIYLFPFIEREMNLTNTDLGLAMSVLAITWGLSSVIFSYLSDKFGRSEERRVGKWCGLQWMTYSSTDKD